MLFGLRTEELIVVLAGLLLFVSLPMVAQDSYAIWWVAQGLYFVGVVLITVKFFRSRV